jgi:hypothetical protein
MLPLETKQSGGKLLPQSDLRGGVFLDEASRRRKRDILVGQVAGTCEYGNELSGSVKCGEFLD